MSQSEDFYRAVYSDDVHLAPSKKTDGAYRGTVLNNETNVLAGQAEFIKVEMDDDSPEDYGHSPELPPAVLAAALGIIGTIAVIKQAPHIKSWWLEGALPALKLKWSMRPGSKDDESEAAFLDSAPPVEIEPAEFSREIVVALEDSRAHMSSAEAQKRFLAMLMAAAFVAEQARLLKNVHIEDAEKRLDLKKAMDQLSTQQVADFANRLLEADDTLLDEETQAVFMAVFSGGGKVDGKYAPLRREEIEMALRLTNN